MKKVLDTGHLLVVVWKYTPCTAEVERVYHATVLNCTAKSVAFSSLLRWVIRQASQRSTAYGKQRNLNRVIGNSQDNLVPMLTTCLLPRGFCSGQTFSRVVAHLIARLCDSHLVVYINKDLGQNVINPGHSHQGI